MDTLRNLARDRSIRWSIIVCGSRNNTLQDFRSALRSHPDAFNVLLVDAEAPVTVATPTVHLQRRDSWDMTGITDEQCHLMVEVMENWFLADVDALESFYGKGFNRNAIPPTQNVEQIAKTTVERVLADASRNTTKGKYHKIQHGTQLLAKVNPAIVRSRAPYCDHLFTVLQQAIQVETQ